MVHSDYLDKYYSDNDSLSNLQTRIENNVKSAQETKKKWEDLKNDAQALSDISSFEKLNENIGSIDKIISDHNQALDAVKQELLTLHNDIEKEKKRLNLKQELFESKNIINYYSKTLDEFIINLNRIIESRSKN